MIYTRTHAVWTLTAPPPAAEQCASADRDTRWDITWSHYHSIFSNFVHCWLMTYDICPVVTHFKIVYKPTGTNISVQILYLIWSVLLGVAVMQFDTMSCRLSHERWTMYISEYRYWLQLSSVVYLVLKIRIEIFLLSNNFLSIILFSHK